MFCVSCQEWVSDMVGHTRLLHNPDDAPELMPDGRHYVVIDETEESMGNGQGWTHNHSDSNYHSDCVACNLRPPDKTTKEK